MRRLQPDRPDVPERRVREPIGVLKRRVVRFVERGLVGLKLRLQGAGWRPLRKFGIFGQQLGLQRAGWWPFWKLRVRELKRFWVRRPLARPQLGQAYVHIRYPTNSVCGGARWFPDRDSG